tara:strand:- start:347 stop:484 length:138 start_codon:yes stop_codon:yes gene_type:complete
VVIAVKVVAGIVHTVLTKRKGSKLLKKVNEPSIKLINLASLLKND